jgi:hypothetical protein
MTRSIAAPQRLIEMGYATAKDGAILVPGRAVASLEEREIERVGRQMATERGLTYTPTKSRRPCQRTPYRHSLLDQRTVCHDQRRAPLSTRPLAAGS